VFERFGVMTLATALWIMIFVRIALSPAITPTGATRTPQIPRVFTHRTTVTQAVERYQHAPALERFE
jgi:hypothetical protein